MGDRRPRRKYPDELAQFGGRHSRVFCQCERSNAGGAWRGEARTGGFIVITPTGRDPDTDTWGEELQFRPESRAVVFIVLG